MPAIAGFWADSIRSDSRRKAASRARSRCGTTWSSSCWPTSRLPGSPKAPSSDRLSLPTGVPQDEEVDRQGDERHRHLPDDEAPAEGGGPAGPVLAPLVPRGDGDHLLEQNVPLEKAQAMAAHESPRTTKLYDRTSDAITLDEVERIMI